MGRDSLYIVGACTGDNITDRDLNGNGWRTKYAVPLIYQISNYGELGKEMSMFSATQYTPQLVIIGQDLKITFSHQGYITPDEIKIELQKAFGRFGNLHQVKKIENMFIDDTKAIIDLSEYFITVNSGSISYEVISVSDDTIVTPSLISSQLTLTKGKNTGIVNVKVKAMPSSETVIDSFDVMIYPTDANVVDFETGLLYDHWYFQGNEDWIKDPNVNYEGLYSAKSGDISTISSPDSVTYSLLMTTFHNDRDDTLSFAYKISSQYENDGFEFFLDGVWTDFPDSKWSGEIDWSFAEYFVKAGDHTVEWDYFKWGPSAAGKDAAWLDIIKIPGVITGIEEVAIPSKTQLNGNYPNPFNGSTTITYQLSDISNVKLAVYNIKGEIVSELINERQNRGEHKALFNALNINSGVYFYKLEAGEEVQTGKMIYLK